MVAITAVVAARIVHINNGAAITMVRLCVTVLTKTNTAIDKKEGSAIAGPLLFSPLMYLKVVELANFDLRHEAIINVRYFRVTVNVDTAQTTCASINARRGINCQ